MPVPERAYAAPAGHFDEMTLPSGEPRADWRRLLASLDGLGRDELERRRRDGERLLRENGVTYNVYGDPRGMDRPWQLDPIPLLIPEGEWGAIESAVVQRAQLLDRVLADLYGAQRLLRDGLLPAELALASPGYLRPCRGLRVPNDRFLHVYAVDLARSPDGRWWVIGDRTQAPSGAGYALENRVVLSRILPEPFRDFHVRRLAGWFRDVRDGLAALGPTTGGPERVVILTPGPYNETYFEHAYLARYLGFPLVEGADLTVRDERVFLRTLDGLLPVDVILRRQDDAWCDPLELLGESALGVPGLVQAARAGNVVVANALGSGLVESAAMMAFLPGLSRAILGEELQMPSVATWWCGQEAERDYVRRNLDALVVKPTYPCAGADVVFGGELDGDARDAFLGRLAAAPGQFVAQERVALSTAPSASGEGGPAPRHLVLRVFASSASGTWQVMPGGLTRVATSAASLVVSSQRGGGSKDTWVLASRPVPWVSLLDRSAAPEDVSRAGFALTSRTADNLLWLGRTSERVEGGARLFRAALRRLAEEPLRVADAAPPDAVRLLERSGRVAAPEEKGAFLEERVLAALYDRERPGALGASVRQLHRLAWLLRDRLSADSWRVLARLDEELAEPAGVHPALRVSTALDRLDRTLLSLSAFNGLVMESMTRALGWQFLDLGRRIERGIEVVDLLRAALADGAEPEWRRLETILEVADSAMTYRSRYQTSVQTPLVVDLLLRDEANPRSVAFQLAELGGRLASLPKADGSGAAALLARVRSAPIAALGERERGSRAEIEALLRDVAQALPRVFDAVNHAYLVHALPRRRSA
jgi:uncharacterized circularly permuted ATP-grasp superfamily protein/uncharacterized alpha-E superfamily protein